MKSPLLLILFNRPEATQRIVSAAIAASPSKIYLAADSPRADRPSEVERCARVREIALSANWGCPVETLFQNRNLGCRYGPKQAIDWFFSKEQEGIILEDDCMPHPDFFKYCDWALDTYRSDPQVWHVSGSNFNAPKGLYESKPIAFTGLAQVWGWATWASRWGRYECNPFYLEPASRQPRRFWQISPVAKSNELRHLRLLRQGLDAWDYQWQITILNNRGLCLSPSANLINNIGDGPDATHTRNDRRTHSTTSAIEQELTPVQPALNKGLTTWYEKRMGLRHWKAPIANAINRVRVASKKRLQDLLASALFPRARPIVVASTGRSGSTLLFDAIANSVARRRFGNLLFNLAPVKLRKASQTFISRLSDLPFVRHPVVKTHDLFEPSATLDAKFVFVYGDPEEAALSARRMAQISHPGWLDEHLYNLRSQASPSELLQTDALNFEQQFDSWTGTRHPSVFVVRFEAIWEKAEEISAFLGLPIELPPKQPRSEKTRPQAINAELFERLRSRIEDRSDRNAPRQKT